MKNNLFLRFGGSFTLYLLVIIAIALFPLYKYGNSFLVSGSLGNTAFFYILTLASYYIIVKSIRKDGTLINAFLGGIVMKLLLAMVYLFIFLKKFPGHEVDFAITFFASYLICTGFEVYYILHNLRQN